MSESKTRPVDLEDLSVRARRGSLSDAERRSFEQALRTSRTLHVAHQVGCDFDRIGAVRSGDDELIARVIDTVVKAPRTRAAQRRGLRLGVMIAATLAATSAGAAWWSAQENRDAASSQHSAKALRGSSGTAEHRAQEADPVPDRGRASETETPRSEELVVSPPTAQSRSHPAEPSEPVTPKTLFRDANAARRDGDFGRATALYTELGQRFPRSDEARLSHVSMGKLLLASGKASGAERQFAAYLASGGGALTEEALVGRAQSLQTLGRASEEGLVWQELLRKFPTSVYAARARQRLAKAAEARP